VNEVLILCPLHLSMCISYIPPTSIQKDLHSNLLQTVHSLLFVAVTKHRTVEMLSA